MKSRFIDLVGVVFLSGVTFFAEASGLAADTNFIPIDFCTSIGGSSEHSYSVELKNGVLKYSEDISGKRVHEITLTPTAKQWKDFQTALNNLNVWKWHSEYRNSNILDGTAWSLDIKYSERTLHARGFNEYPTWTGKPGGKPEPTKAFKTYLAAVRNLLGGKEFE